MIKSFLFNVAGLTGSFTLDDRETGCINYIKKTVGNKKVVVCIAVFSDKNFHVRTAFFNSVLSFQSLLSGGVDSTICTVLLHKALPAEQIIAVHIDNGFMRKDESMKVAQSLRDLGLTLTGTTKYVTFK